MRRSSYYYFIVRALKARDTLGILLNVPFVNVTMKGQKVSNTYVPCMHSSSPVDTSCLVLVPRG